jgi:hypothetical protein
MIRIAACCAIAGMAVTTVLAAGAAAQPGATGRLTLGAALPPLKGEFLTGREARLPDVAKGKAALLLLGFTYKSRFAVEAWSEHFVEAFGTKPDITSFQVPIIGGMARLGRFFIDRGMRNGTPKELHERVVTVYGGVDEWKKRVGFRDQAADAAHLILLDREGKVRWLYNGPFDPQAFDEMRQAATALLAPSASDPAAR